MPQSFGWDALGKKEERLRCMSCDNALLLLIQQPVARKVHKHKSHRMRVIAECPLCKKGGTDYIGSGELEIGVIKAVVPPWSLSRSGKKS